MTDLVAERVALLIAAEVRIYREGLAQVLGQLGRITVSGTAGDAAEVMAGVDRSAPDVVLLDMAMPGSGAVLQALSNGSRHVAVVAFSVTDRNAQLIECIRAGVFGFVPRDASLPDLVAAVERAARGHVTCPPAIAARLFQEIAGRGAHLETADQDRWALTARERQVAALIDRGCSNKEIARSLDITLSTVKNHVHSILEKCQVSRRGDAARMLASLHLATAPDRS